MLDDATLDARLRSLAHPVRRRLVTACLESDQPAGRLVELADGLAAASVSEHLKVLRKSGILVLEKQGRFRVYRADPEALIATADRLRQLAGA